MPPVYLNHLFVMLETETYNEIVTSDFIKSEFGVYEQRTTKAAEGLSWTGTYLYGENTYIELFDIANVPSFIEQSSGVALGVDEHGGSEWVRSLFSDRLHAEVLQFLRARKTDGVDIPWFRSTAAEYPDQTPRLLRWVMEYHQDYLKKWYPELPPVEPGVRRRDILERFAAKVGSDTPSGSKYFKDVIEVRLALNGDEAEQFARELEVLDYSVQRENEEHICQGPDIRFVIAQDEASSPVITGIRMTLYQGKEGQKVYKFGPNSVLSFHSDGTATWTF